MFEVREVLLALDANEAAGRVDLRAPPFGFDFLRQLHGAILEAAAAAANADRVRSIEVVWHLSWVLGICHNH
jgi:hypothetical protein